MGGSAHGELRCWVPQSSGCGLRRDTARHTSPRRHGTLWAMGRCGALLAYRPAESLLIGLARMVLWARMTTALVQLGELSGVREVLLSEGGGMARYVTGIDVLAEPMRIAKGSAGA